MEGGPLKDQFPQIYTNARNKDALIQDAYNNTKRFGEWFVEVMNET